MYAYVKLLEGSQKGNKIKIKVSKIKHDFNDKASFNKCKKYLVEDKDGGYCKACIIYMENTEAELDLVIKKGRIKLVPEARLQTDSDVDNSLVKSKSVISIKQEKKDNNLKQFASLLLMKEGQLKRIIEGEHADETKGEVSDKNQKDTVPPEKSAEKLDVNSIDADNENSEIEDIDPMNKNKQFDGSDVHKVNEKNGNDGNISMNNEKKIQDSAVNYEVADKKGIDESISMNNEEHIDDINKNELTQNSNDETSLVNSYEYTDNSAMPEESAQKSDDDKSMIKNKNIRIHEEDTDVEQFKENKKRKVDDKTEKSVKKSILKENVNNTKERTRNCENSTIEQIANIRPAPHESTENSSIQKIKIQSISNIAVDRVWLDKTEKLKNKLAATEKKLSLLKKEKEKAENKYSDEKKNHKELKMKYNTCQDLNVKLQEIMYTFFIEKKTVDRQRENVGAHMDVRQNFLPIGYHRRNDDTIHIGRGQIMQSNIYNNLILHSKTPSQFVGNSLLALFDEPTLLQSTVSGKPSNRILTKLTKELELNKSNGNENGSKKIDIFKPLDPLKLNALKDLYGNWLKNEYKPEEGEIGSAFDQEINKFNEYVSKKISYLKRPKRPVGTAGSACSKSKKKYVTKNDEESGKKNNTKKQLPPVDNDFDQDASTSAANDASDINNEMDDNLSYSSVDSTAELLSDTESD